MGGRHNRYRGRRNEVLGQASASLVESIERRWMLSASISHHVLLIDGSPHSDSIVLTRGKRAVTVDVNGETSVFSLKSFGRIRIRTGRGNDLVMVGTINNPIAKGADIAGSDGDDTMIGGGGNDRIDGGRGNDQLAGAGGIDKLIGGRGNDQLWGGLGNDRLYGGGGRDRLDGGAGQDLLSGGKDNDELHDGAGLDTVFGNGGRDAFFMTADGQDFMDHVGRERMSADVNAYELVATPAPDVSRSVAPSGVVPRFMLAADALVRGGVNFTTLTSPARHLHIGGNEMWSVGDLNLDGTVDSLDQSRLSQYLSSSSYAGAVTVNAGTLRIDAGALSGFGSVTASGGTLSLSNSSSANLAIGSGAINITGGITTNSGGTTVLGGLLTGHLVINTDATFNIGLSLSETGELLYNGSAVTLPDGMTIVDHKLMLNGQTLTLPTGATISGTGSLLLTTTTTPPVAPPDDGGPTTGGDGSNTGTGDGTGGTDTGDGTGGTDTGGTDTGGTDTGGGDGGGGTTVDPGGTPTDTGGGDSGATTTGGGDNNSASNPDPGGGGGSTTGAIVTTPVIGSTGGDYTPPSDNARTEQVQDA